MQIFVHLEYIPLLGLLVLQGYFKDEDSIYFSQKLVVHLRKGYYITISEPSFGLFE